ncbi:hypothetical protein KQ693_05890 [Thermus sp. PS18]|uniref:hypothetical protein n=1 Tax=Thermus sp. PS18 TaxID=2849039 RepID=UPI002264AA6D|nr:hypothetical protein [Thermus sp. PS18]UZX16560.1 hypothetical protein KQ693_05890 [Thermus sp. PS18]
MRPDEQTLERLRAEHGEVYWVEAAGVGLVVRPPRRAEYRRFRAMTLDPERRGDATERLVRDCVVWPSPEELDRILETRPALADAVASRLLELAGAVEEVQLKKL